VDEPTGFDKNRGAIFGRCGLAAAVRSEAEDERPSPAASNPTLSATCDINFIGLDQSICDYVEEHLAWSELWPGAVGRRYWPGVGWT
jgi:hypothetical protein